MVTNRRAFRWLVVVMAIAVYMTIPAAALADHGGTPNATVTPHLGLDADSPVVVTVAATGVPPSTEMNVMECLPNNCFQIANPTSAADGSLSIQVSVRWSYGYPSTECNWDDGGAFCYVRVYYVNPIPGGNDILFDSIELTFAGHDRRIVNRQPTCAPMSIAVNEDNVAAGSIDCVDADGDSLFGSLMTAPAHGNVGFGPNGAYLYTPEPDYHGPDAFTYVAFDGAQNSALATATIAVTAVNDLPIATADAFSTAFETTLTVAVPGVLANDSDVDGDTLAAELVSTTTHGALALAADGSFVYLPEDGFSGVDSFVYRAQDGTAQSDGVTVTITVEPAPINHAPSCSPVALSTRPGQAISGTLVCTDEDGDALTYTKLTDIRGGTWTLASNGAFTFVPGKTVVGTVVLAYRASDGQAAADGSISFTIVANRAPDCKARLISGPINHPISGTMTCTDADGDAVTYAPLTKVRLGSWSLSPSGTFTFTPGSGFVGDVVLTYRASDGTATSSGTITFRIVNAPPTCPAMALSVPRGTTVSRTLSCTDPDGSQLTYSLSKLKVKNGTVTISANGTLTFVPTASFVGTQVIPFNVSDGTSTVSGSISLTFS